MGKEEIFRNALVEYLQTQLEGEQRKCGKYAEVVEAQKKASDEARKVLETMPKEAGEAVEKYVDSIFATAIEDWLLTVSYTHLDVYKRQVWRSYVF